MLNIKLNAVGVDGINPKFIKIIIPAILDPVAHVMNIGH